MHDFSRIMYRAIYNAFKPVPISRIRIFFYLISAIILFIIGIGIGHDGVPPLEQFSTFGYYFFIGVFAAVIANSTGAGGGIVFLPAFISLGLTSTESLATSLAIQCFGMTSGCLTWIKYSQQERLDYPLQWQGFSQVVVIGAISSWAGLLGAQYWLPHPPLDVELFFSLFSLAVGCMILYRTLTISKETPGRTDPLRGTEWLGLVIACFIGGGVTAWISVGVGEILAIYLIYRGLRVNVAIASAVCVTAPSVLISIPYHAVGLFSINLDVLVYAAPGALIGGAIAQQLAVYLGAHRLKITMATWIILSALIYLPFVAFGE